MSNWAIVKDNIVIDMIVSDSKEYVENNFDAEILEDDGYIGIGWTNIDGSWKAPYPADGLTYTWNDETKRWDIVFSPDEESIVE